MIYVAVLAEKIRGHDATRHVARAWGVPSVGSVPPKGIRE